MAEKQFLDQEGLTELVNQTKSYVDSEIAANAGPWTVSGNRATTSYPIVKIPGVYLSTGDELGTPSDGYHAIPGAIFGSGPNGVGYGYQNAAPISPALILATDYAGTTGVSGLTFSATHATTLADAAWDGNAAVKARQDGAMDIIFDQRGVGTSGMPGLHFRYWDPNGHLGGEAALEATMLGTPASPSVILTSDNWQQHLGSISDITNALHVTDENHPYLKLESTDNSKEVQVMTGGYFGGDDSNGSGMGLKFQSKDTGGQDKPQDYGNISIKADPRHGWNHVLTLPNETGTLATRNYADDAIDAKVTTQQIGFIRNISPSAQDEYNLYDIPEEATGVEVDVWFYCSSGTVSNNLYIGFGTTNASYPHATWETIQYDYISEATADLNTAPHLKMFMSREPGSATAKYLVMNMGRGSLAPTRGSSSYLIDKIVCDKPQNARIFGFVRIYLKGDMAPQIAL